MYNRYISDSAGFTRADEGEGPHTSGSPPPHWGEGGAHSGWHQPPPPGDQQKGSRKISAFIDGLLKQFKLEGLDTGDILLVLIILFLFIDGDDLEIVIALGLMLLFGVLDKGKDDAAAADDADDFA